MWPPSEVAGPRGSFLRPVPIVPFDPGESPTTTVTLNCFWLPYIRGALQQLVLQATWDPLASQDDLNLVQARAMTLIDLFQECSGSNPLPFACIGDFDASANPFATWAIDFSGVWIPSQGYGPTSASSGGTTYNGAEITCTFDNPINISDIRIVYDYVKGNLTVPGSFIGLYMDDDTHSQPIGTGLTYDQLSNGFDQVYHSGPATSSAVDVIRIGLYCDEFTSGVTLGNMRIHSVEIVGTAIIAPC